MTKDEKQQWALAQYENGDTVRGICSAIGISTPTFYRWLRDQIAPRRPERMNTDSSPCPHRSKAAKTAWIEKRYTATDKTIRQSRQLSLLEILQRLSLSLSLDNMGHFIVHGQSDKRLYLTDTEFKALTKDPTGTLRALSGRINSTFKQEVE